MSDVSQRTWALTVIEWLLERHHQSLGLWPWTWTGPAGERYVTLYAHCTALRFGGDFAALANWIEASRWPPPDGTPHLATFYRDRLGSPLWAVRPPAELEHPFNHRAAQPDLAALARAGTPTETLAQFLESASGLDRYLATVAPLRHGGHAHRDARGYTAVLMMRLATDVALHVGEDYTIPWTGPAGGRANGIADPDWHAFMQRFRLRQLPFPLSTQDTFVIGDRGWLHADGWAGDAHGNVVNLRLAPDDEPGFAQARALVRTLLASD